MKKYPKFKRKQLSKFFNKLSKKEKDIISDYIKYRTARGTTTKDKQEDIKRYILHIRYIIKKDFDKFNNEDIVNFVSLLVNSDLSKYSQNDIKVNLKNFLKWEFRDWSSRFYDMEDLLKTKKVSNEEKINHKTILKKSDIEKIVKHEHRTFWKAFFLVQYEAGLRTKETRYIKWEDINLNSDDDISEINIYATKTKKSRVVFVKEATYYLNLLKTQQENSNKKGVYIFHSPQDVNKPISKSGVNQWFRKLSSKVLGRKCWNYLLRHSRSSELYSLANENKISEDTPMRLLGHKKSMKEVYCHLNPEAIKEVLKKQLYHLEDIPLQDIPKIEEIINKRIQEAMKKYEQETKEWLLNTIKKK